MGEKKKHYGENLYFRLSSVTQNCAQVEKEVLLLFWSNFAVDNRFYLNQSELYEDSIRKDVKGIQMRKELGLYGKDEEYFLSALNQLLPISRLHNTMFIPMIESLVQPKQDSFIVLIAEIGKELLRSENIGFL